MQRRALLILATLAWPAWGPAAPLGMDAALFVEPDAPPQALWRVQPAQGPLDRHAGRPGAWVGLLYLPMLPGQPAELVLRTALRRHTLRLLALDQAPADAPSVAAVLPLEPNSRQDGERPSFHVSRFMLPATSLADGLYVLTLGSVSVIGHDGEGTQRFLSISPGMMLGETALLDGGGRSADAVADSFAVLQHLSRAALQRLADEHPAIAAQLYCNIGVHLSRRLRAATLAWSASQR